jgi:hypothetical protein
MEQHVSKTPKAKLEQIYALIRQRVLTSKDEIGKKIEFSRTEFVDAMLTHEEFLNLFELWERSGFSPRLAPILLLKKPHYNYTFKNIEFVPLWKASEKKYRKAPTIPVELQSLHRSLCITLHLLGYNMSEIGSVMKMDRSSILRIMNMATEEEYAVAEEIATHSTKIKKQ